MLKACKYCGRVHDSKFNCGHKPQRAKEDTEISKLRTCRRWDRTRQAAYERDHYLCRLCFAEKRFTSQGLEAHHIVPLVEDADLAYELDNVITLCTKHHKAADKGQISRSVLQTLTQEPF